MADRIQGANRGVTLPAQSIYEESSTALHKLGTRLVIGERTFFYCKNGAVALTAGLVVAAINTLTSEDTVTVAHGIGTYDVTVTASGIAANDFAEGWLVVDEGTGVGTTYKIRSNTATVSGVIVCTLYDPLAVAWATADTDVTLTPSIYNAVVVSPTAGVSLPVGVPLIGVTASYYFWAQTWGPCGVKMDVSDGGGNSIDERVLMPSPDHAGQIIVDDTPTADHMPVGFIIITAADHGDNKTEPIFLNLAR